MFESEARRLENLWRGSFGDQYIDRNSDIDPRHEAFWKGVLQVCQPSSVLEVGCNIGVNLHWIVKYPSQPDVYGLDVNEKALGIVRRELAQVSTVLGSARGLPFRNDQFDLVLTMGVLIHLAPDTLLQVMNEIVRCSHQFIFCGEYFADQTVEVPYRGEVGALYKADFGGLYQKAFPQLLLRSHGSLSPDTGWDDVTYWIFEKPCASSAGASP